MWVIAGFILISIILQGVIMATVSTINEKVAALALDVERVRALVQSLKDQIAQGSVATQADIDAIDAAVAAVQASLASVS